MRTFTLSELTSSWATFSTTGKFLIRTDPEYHAERELRFHIDATVWALMGRTTSLMITVEGLPDDA